MVSRTNCNINYDRLIGRGRQGSVYEVCCDDNCDYLVKITEKTNTTDMGLKISLLASENGIGPKIYDAWEEDNKVFILMERLIPFVDSKAFIRYEEEIDYYLDPHDTILPVKQRQQIIDLFVKMNGEYPTEQNILDVMEKQKLLYMNLLYAAVYFNNYKVRSDFANKLSKLHSLGYYHGDIQLGNIMLNKENKLVFIDYGFSGVLSSLNSDEYKRDNLQLMNIFNFFRDNFPYIKS